MPTPNRYPIPAATHRTEEEINRSRFVTTLGYTPTVKAARAFIEQANTERGSTCCNAYTVESIEARTSHEQYRLLHQSDL